MRPPSTVEVSTSTIEQIKIIGHLVQLVEALSQLSSHPADQHNVSLRAYRKQLLGLLGHSCPADQLVNLALLSTLAPQPEPMKDDIRRRFEVFWPMLPACDQAVANIKARRLPESGRHGLTVGIENDWVKLLNGSETELRALYREGYEIDSCCVHIQRQLTHPGEPSSYLVSGHLLSLPTMLVLCEPSDMML